MGGGVDRRMGAHEEELQPLVGELRIGRLAGPALGDEADRVDARRFYAVVPFPVEEPVPRRLEEPRLGRARGAVARPGVEGGEERVAERVLRGGDVARVRREVGDEPTVGVAGDRLDGAARVVHVTS